MEWLGKSLGGMVSRGIGGKQRGLWQLTRRWPELVGVPLSMRSLPVRITDKGVLHVRVQGSSAAQELALLKASLLPALAEYGVTSLRTRVSTRAATTMPRTVAVAVEQKEGVSGEALRQAYRQKVVKERPPEGVGEAQGGSYNDPAGGEAPAPEAFAGRLDAAFRARQRQTPPGDTP